MGRSWSHQNDLVFWNTYNVQSSVICKGSPRSRWVAEYAVVKHYGNSKRIWTQCQKMAEFPVTCEGKNYGKAMAPTESVYFEGLRFGGSTQQVSITPKRNRKPERIYVREIHFFHPCGRRKIRQIQRRNYFSNSTKIGDWPISQESSANGVPGIRKTLKCTITPFISSGCAWPWLQAHR